MRVFVLVASALVASMLLAQVQADLYLHFPPGSNDRNRERNDDRNNANMLFDSQNNARGGYPWNGDPTLQARPDPVTYYAGSQLRIEWTNQHGCGANPNLACTLIIQYACSPWMPGIRDGYPDSGTLEQSDNNNAGYFRRRFRDDTGQNQDGTNTIPENKFPDAPAQRAEYYYEGANGGVEFAMHEGINYYDECKLRQRNKGLYAADQNVNLNDARATRQNNNGQRHGLECAEERDYYPYWAPTPWIDAAILTSNAKDYCDFFTENSQNTKRRGYCKCTDAARQNAPDRLNPWSETVCRSIANCEWLTDTSARPNVDKPACLQHDFGRDNHLGNSQPQNEDKDIIADAPQQETAHYVWTVPDMDIMTPKDGVYCAIRLRYNMSTGDYPNMNYALGRPQADFTSAQNCPNGQITQADREGNGQLLPNDPKPHCRGVFNSATKPLFNRPYVNVFGNRVNGVEQRKLSIALNTDQSSRTFQDRSYVFRVQGAPSSASGTIYNLGVRGRRGNIVQTYPAVEYDFTPNTLEMSEKDTVHIQIHGTDFNAARNANNGEGWQYSSRSNIVEVLDRSSNFPAALDQITMFSPKGALFWALLGQDPSLCGEYFNGKTNEQNAVDNCSKLNMAPRRFPPNPEDGLVRLNSGTYHYISTRNNNFSNRSQKASIVVGKTGLTAGQIAGIVIGSLAGIGLIAGGVLFYGKRHRNTPAGRCYNSCAGGFDRCTSKCRRGGTPAATGETGSTTAVTKGVDQEYRRY